MSIYSHIAMTIYFTLMLLVTFFTVYFKEIFTKKNILYLFSASSLILLLTASFWMPLLEIKLKGSFGIFVPYLLTGKGDLRFSTLKIWELFPFSKMQSESMIFHMQLFVIIIFLISIFYLLKKKMWKEKFWIFSILFTILSVIMVTPIFPWYYTPSILQTLQFPWRLALYMTLSVILICGIYLKQFENKKSFDIMCIIFIGLVLFSTFYYIGHLDKNDINLDDIDYSKGLGNQAEYLPEKTLKDKEYLNNRENGIIIKSGAGNIEIISDNIPNLTFEAKLDEEMIVELPRIYYLGYNLELNGEKVKLEENDNGFLTAKIYKSGRYVLEYNKTFVMRFSTILSMITFLILIVVYVRLKDKVGKIDM